MTQGVFPSIPKYNTCTDITRPSSPAVGDVVFETNTGFERTWNGSSWPRFGGAPRVVSGTYTTNVIFNTSVAQQTFMSNPITMANDGLVRILYKVEANSTTTGFGFLYLQLQIDGVTVGAGEAFGNTDVRRKVDMIHEAWLTAGGHTIRMIGNNGVASGRSDINVDTNAGASPYMIWIYD